MQYGHCRIKFRNCVLTAKLATEGCSFLKHGSKENLGLKYYQSIDLYTYERDESLIYDLTMEVISFLF